MKLSDGNNDKFTLLAVHAHPDDESISTGGVLAKHSAKGTYLHPDHIMANRVTLRAFQASADPKFEIDEALEPWQPTKLYYTAIPPERIRRMHRIAKEQGEDPGLDPEVIGTMEEKISASVDVGRYLSPKLEALNCHQSKMNPNSIIRRMSEEFREEVMGYEHFQCVYGCRTTDIKV